MSSFGNRILSDISSGPFGPATEKLNFGEQLDSGIPRQIATLEVLAPFHKASTEEKDRRVRDVLARAWREYRRGGAMLDAIDAISGAGPEGPYAKIELRRVLLELNLQAWEAHPMRTRADVHRLFRRVIGKLTPHRGGWRVGVRSSK